MASLESNILFLRYSNELALFEAVVAQSVDDSDGTLYMSLMDTSWKTQRRGNDIVFMFSYADWSIFTDWCSIHSLSIMKINEAEWRLDPGERDDAPPNRARSVCSETDRNGNDNALDRAVDKLRAGQSMFITGEGGCGKSYLAWQLFAYALQEMKWDSDHIAVTAYTGVAAQELYGKKPVDIVLTQEVSTLHSFMGISPGIKTVAQLQDLIEKTPALRARWTSTFLLIIDEVSMVDSVLFTMLHEMRARFNNRMVLICLGDFCQLPPHDTRNKVTGDATPDFCFLCPAWRTLIARNVIVLTTNYRIDGDREWRKLLTRLRMGHQTDLDRRFLVRLQQSDIRPVTEEHVHIYCRRRQVKEYNDGYFQNLIADGRAVMDYNLQWTNIQKLTNLRGRVPIVTVLTAQVESPESPVSPVSPYPADIAAREFMMKIVGELPGMPDNDILASQVRLCVGARVIYERNLLDDGLGNGMQGTVMTMEPEYVEVLFDNRTSPIRVNFINHTELSEVVLVEGQQIQYKATCRILPLQLAGAITVHKSQGMTLNKVYIKLYDEVFTAGGRVQRVCTIDFPGQLYVALSRGRTSENIIVDSTFGGDANADWQRVKPHPEVVAYYSSLYDAMPASATQPRSRSLWGNMLNPHWLNGNIVVTETPLFILYKREKEYNERLHEQRLKKLARK